MRLVELRIENYRSITKARQIRFDDTTVLLGPNNEGKSNILQALVTGLEILTGIAEDPNPYRAARRGRALRTQLGFRREGLYDWARDFPVSLQESKPNGKSILRLTFKLDEKEISDFKQEIGSNLNGDLPIDITLTSSPKNTSISVAKQGKAHKYLTSKSSQIAAFVASRLAFDYIPAVRTAEDAQRIVLDLVSRELQSAEKDPEYRKALQQIKKLQEPILGKIAESIRETLQIFLPEVRDVILSIPDNATSNALRRYCDIVVDDGTPTHLHRKGDGVQSLAALGIMRMASQTNSLADNLIIALEEPESHLHPKAIHSLRDVLEELSHQHQIVLSTHCPLFVTRDRIGSNIIVKNSLARPAKNIEEIRDVLGVRASDNLQGAQLVLVVEGEDDRIALRSLLSYYSPELKKSFQQRMLAIDTLGGASNLCYKVGVLRNSLCGIHAFLDNDDAGERARDDALEARVLKESEITLAFCPGRPQAEFEDIYKEELYRKYLIDVHGVSISKKIEKDNRSKKWSDRLMAQFMSNGQPISKSRMTKIKHDIADLVQKSPGAAIHDQKRAVFDSLVMTLERKLTREV